MEEAVSVSHLGGLWLCGRCCLPWAVTGEPAQWLQGSKERPQGKAGGGFGTAKPVAGGPQGTVALARRKDLGWDPMACDDPLSPHWTGLCKAELHQLLTMAHVLSESR